MRKTNVIYIIILTVLLIIPVAFAENNDSSDKVVISNKLFSLSLPAVTKNTYTIKKEKDTVLIYDKVSQKAGYGGFVFGIKAYKHPSEHAMMPGGEKIGELTNKMGFIYDMVLIRPTDVQYDYVNGISDSYKTLYNLSSDLESDVDNKIIIEGKGKNKYYKNQGMKGGDLYKKILQKHITAIEEKWDSTKLEKEHMSYMYNVLSSSNKNMKDKIGYAYYDINGDGIEELLIGEIADVNCKCVIYDIYTMVNRKPAHVISGGNSGKYYVCNESFLCNEYSSGADECCVNVYILVENSVELYPQVGFKSDSSNTGFKSWYISYNLFKDEWKYISESAFKERKSVFEKYKRFDYLPLSKVK